LKRAVDNAPPGFYDAYKLGAPDGTWSSGEPQ